MSDFTMPLGGAVTQSILPWTWAFTGSNNQVGLFNIYLGQSSNPDVERDALDVASYGKQLGRIEDALLVLIAKVFPEPLPEGAQKDAIDDLKSMVHELQLVKKRHKPA